MANTKNESANEQWDCVESLLERWLIERQDLITLYCRVSSSVSFSKDSHTIERQLKHFCQLLLDYISAGHFEVYEELFKEAYAFQDTQCLTAQSFYEKVQATTDQSLQFNDNVNEWDFTTTKLDKLYTSLSKLGESIELRFEFEDKLIDQLHIRHKGQVA
ncbi:MAG: sigma D regulator [Gammaproteobacteria bacterium]|nr:MAG: sigma D regulator [Gammaproteobacteria bacterium]